MTVAQDRQVSPPTATRTSVTDNAPGPLVAGEASGREVPRRLALRVVPAGSSGAPVATVSAGNANREADLAARLAAKRAELASQLGLVSRPIEHFKKPVENLFTAAQRPHTTLLFGGLTFKHEHLIKAAFEGLGYLTDVVPTPEVADFQAGKEFGNNGQCNPTYFTVGALVNYLRRLRDQQGLSTRHILENYIFLTAGACGPCRFGMYEAEYRLALRNAGFEGFRVVLFQQRGGLNQSQAEMGLQLNMNFFLKLINGFNVGDLLNEVGYQMRPYEVQAGQTDAVMTEIMDDMKAIMKHARAWSLDDAWWSRHLRGSRWEGLAESLGKFIGHVTTDDYAAGLRRARQRLGRIPLDRLRPKPMVKITGEFWAQTTEGDGNFHMFAFLEREGAEVYFEPIITWLMYLLHQVKQELRDRWGLKEGPIPAAWWQLGRRWRENKDFYLRYHRLTVAETLLSREYCRLGGNLNPNFHLPTDQYQLQRLGHPHYNSRAAGGEGHLEVAKNIYYSNRDLAHMVLSLKPFGCMPSTQSDGAQSAVVNLYKDMIFLPLETSGEGEVNAHSRVQMALGEARVKTKAEFAAAVEASGQSLEALRSYAASRPAWQRFDAVVPPVKGTVGTAAKMVHAIAAEMTGRPLKTARAGH